MMEGNKERYSNPLIERYASAEMGGVLSDFNKFRTWRRCWIALAEAEAELGLAISKEQLDELRAKREDINFEAMARLERELRHDVMAGIHAYGEQCPKARGIIHLGATSCFVTDNTELIQYHQALQLVRGRMLRVITELADFAARYRGLRCLGYTHFQPAQPTTLGKRAVLWLQELLLNWEDLEYLLSGYRIRGAKGATGTQDSFLKLFGGDHEKVKALDQKVCEKLGFSRRFPVSGQTYPRLWDTRILDLLKNISQSAHKFAVDFRLMQHLRMVDEPFEEKQVGSSAMAYKRNPMRCERLCSLARYVMSQVPAADHTAANQWFERTLDDSAGRRMYLPQAFLAVDAILLIYTNVVAGARVYPTIITRLLEEELPFLATETIIMQGVIRGGDRQLLHEAVRENAVAAAREIKEQGAVNRLLEMLAEDKRIPFDLEQLKEIAFVTDFSGRAEAQVEEYLRDHVQPVLDQNRDGTAAEGELRV
ncbi:MAG: adenylosuccinate lyase [Spirochaetaceae bacterium]|nr:MAG: adenylosuccinate lyase [Spirochaetaceae bacterium]